ncbi:MAG: GAF domain-containing protein [Armatimonadota bacterium]|nr:PAS domain S-box protein [bacterium]
MTAFTSSKTVIVAGVDLRIVRVNDRLVDDPQSKDTHVYSLKGVSLLDYITELDRHEVEQICARILAGEMFPGGARVCRRIVDSPACSSGKAVILLGPHTDSEGAVDGVIFARFCLDERVETPMHGPDPETLYDYVVNNSNDMVFILDSDGTLEFVNRRAEEHRGVPYSDIVGRHFSEICYPDDISALQRILDNIQISREPVHNLRFRVVLPDGSIRRLVANGGTVSVNGNEKYLCIARDITEYIELREKLTVRNKALAALTDVIISLSDAGHSDKALRLGLSKILDLLGLQQGAVLLSNTRGVMKLNTHCGFNEMALSNPAKRYLIELASLCASTGEMIFVDDTLCNDHGTPELRQEAYRFGIRASVYVPLKRGETVNAVLALGVPPSTELSVEQMEFVRLAVGVLGPAVENARLHVDLTHQVQDLAMLDELMKSVNARKDVRSILESCVKQLSDVIEDGVAVIVLFGVDGSVDVFQYPKVCPMAHIDLARLSLGVMERFMAMASPHIVDDYSEMPMNHPLSDQMVANGSGVVLPLKCLEGLRGTLMVWSPETGRFGKRESQVLESVAEHVVIALTNARLHEAERARSLEMEAIAKEAHHRIKNNLQAILGLLAIGEMEGESAIARCRRQLKAVAAVHDMLVVKECGSADISLSECLAKVAEQALLATGWGNTVELTVESDGLTIRPDAATAVGIIVNEFVCNAVEHGLGECVVNGKIAIRAYREGSKILIEVVDNGVGFPPGFEVPERADSGLGLAASLATYGLGGRLELERVDDKTIARITF